MTDMSEEQRRVKIRALLTRVRERALPLVRDSSSIEGVIKAMIQFEHSRVLYVVNEHEQLIGTISLGLLVRHVFAQSHEPQIHPRLLMGMLMVETARDIMQTKPVCAREDDDVGTVLKSMIEANVKEIPVLDENSRVVGDLTMIDLLKFLSTSEESRTGT